MTVRRILCAVLLILASPFPASATMRVRPYTPLYGALQELARARNVPFEQVLADPQQWLDEVGRRTPRATPQGLSSATEESAEPLPIQFAQSLELGSGFSRLTVGDLDGDGIADLAAAGAASTVAIFAGGALHPLQLRRDVSLEVGDVLQAAADVDGDGKCDLIASRAADTTVSVYRSLGGGGFAAPARYPTGGGYISFIAPGDLTGDGRPDLVIKSDTLLVTLLNTGDGDFVAGKVTGVGVSLDVHVIADFNGDAKQDIALCVDVGDWHQTIRTLLSRGDGSFGPPVDTDNPGPHPYALGAGDFDKDGRVDFFASNPYEVRILVGHGDGTFDDRLIVPLPNWSGEAPMQVADFNSDGCSDIAVGLTSGDCFEGSCGRVAVLLGSETKVCSQPQYYRPASNFVLNFDGEFVCADFDGDNAPDLAGIAAGSLIALMNDGSGAFLAPLSLDLGFLPYGVATARLQANGPPDLLLWDGSSTLIARNLGIQGFARVTALAVGEVVSTQDLDGNGTDDLILASSEYNWPAVTPDSVTVHLNDGAGGLRTPATYCGGSFLTCADFDAANGPDLAVADTSHRVLIRLNNGHGEFGPPLDSGVLLQDHVTAVQGADLDLDGRADLLVGHNEGFPDTLAVYWNLGGSFAAAETYGIATASYQQRTVPSTIALGNFDGDGQPDVLVVDATGADQQGGISILHGAGNRALLPAVEYPTAPDPRAAVVADFDHDGLDDIAVVCDNDSRNGRIRVFRGTPGGVVALGGLWAECYPVSIGLGDFDRDGRADLVVGNLAEPTAMIFRNVSPPDAATPTLVSLISAQTEPGVVHLVWYVPYADAFSVTIERSASDGVWAPLGQASVDGTGRLTWDDRDVTPGARYGYRLRLSASGHETFAGETWVEVPRQEAPLAFALDPVRPNPTRGGTLTVHFTLPTDAPARLELLDVAGRRIASHEVGIGQHTLDLGASQCLAPGIYLVRLTQGENTRTTRAAVLR
jgi:hypothetical protein